MPVFVPLAARIDLLDAIVSEVLAGNATFHLLGSPLTITDATTLAECHAAEATWAGYAPSLGMSWTPAADSGGPNSSTQAMGSWLPSGSSGTVNVYGWYLTDLTATKLYMLSLLPSPPLAISKGTTYNPIFEVDLFSQ